MTPPYSHNLLYTKNMFSAIAERQHKKLNFSDSFSHLQSQINIYKSYYEKMNFTNMCKHLASMKF